VVDEPAELEMPLIVYRVRPGQAEARRLGGRADIDDAGTSNCSPVVALMLIDVRCNEDSRFDPNCVRARLGSSPFRRKTPFLHRTNGKRSMPDHSNLNYKYKWCKSTIDIVYAEFVCMIWGEFRCSDPAVNHILAHDPRRRSPTRKKESQQGQTSRKQRSSSGSVRTRSHWLRSW
jgi:hypothetical protein